MPRAVSEKTGLIYLVRLHPPGRFKIGFTKDRQTLEKRIGDAKTWVTEAEIVGTWPAVEKWERLARFVITSSESIEKAIADFHFGDWTRQAGGGIVDGGDQGVLTDRPGESPVQAGPHLWRRGQLSIRIGPHSHETAQRSD